MARDDADRAEPSVPARRRSNDPVALRSRILDVAATAFQTHGYHATSTHEIVRQAGVSGGAFHHHFPSKKSLGLAVIRDRVAASVDKTWVEPVASASSAAEGILHVFDEVERSIEQRGRVAGCPLNNLALELSGSDGEFRLAVQEVFERWQSAIADKLRADQRSPLRAVKLDPDATAALVVQAYSGAMTMAKASQSSAPLHICAQQLTQLLGS